MILYYVTRRKKKNNRNAAREEKHLTTNFWDFSKKLINGSLYEAATTPSFTKETADTYYTSKYQTSTNTDISKLSWIPKPQPGGSVTPTPFNTNPIRPTDVKGALRRKSSNSSPGPDGVYYGMLKKLSCTHHFMATLFTKVMQSGIPPSNWTRSKVSLLYKSGDSTDPANFRMIALSNAVGKIYHQILAERFEQFMLDNELIDSTLQKAFLKGISGCTEHNVVIHELLSHAKCDAFWVSQPRSYLFYPPKA